MLNIGSFVFGVCAWVFAVLAISTAKAFKSRTNTVVSFCLCAIALVLQLLEVNRRALLGDYAAIEDTIGAVIIGAVVLVSITIILNIAALVKIKDK